MENPIEINHIIGHARTVKTTVMVCEYLKLTLDFKIVHSSCVRYRFTDPQPSNGFWSSDILIVTYKDDGYNKEREEEIDRAVKICRAFVAGAGEIWY